MKPTGIIWLMLLGGLWAGLPARAQAPALRDSARVRLSRGQFAEAVRLLERALEPTAGATHAERVKVLVLLAVTEYYAGRDSLSRSAFRRALVEAPDLSGVGLARLDSVLALMLEEERAALQAATPPRDDAPVPAPAQPPVPSCIRRCGAGVAKPQLVYVPDLEQNLGEVGQVGPSGGRGLTLIRAVVGLDGYLEPASVQIVATNAPGLEQFVRGTLPRLRFRPASAGGAPVRALVEVRFDFRFEGLGLIRIQVSLS